MENWKLIIARQKLILKICKFILVLYKGVSVFVNFDKNDLFCDKKALKRENTDCILQIINHFISIY
jgi:hypothetical protein